MLIFKTARASKKFPSKIYQLLKKFANVIFNRYYDTREVTQGPNLMVKAYEGILDDLRNQEKNL